MVGGSALALGLAACWACVGSSVDGEVQAAALGWNPRALSSGPPILWRAQVGLGHSAVAVQNDRLYTMGSVEQERGGDTLWTDVVSCLDRQTGQVLWQHTYPCDRIHFAGPRATPVIDGDHVFTLSWQGHLHCLDSRSGAVIWKRNIVEDQLAQPGHWGLSGSPVVEGDLLILTAGRSGLALDKATGAVIWQSEPVETSLPPPLVFDSGSRRLAAIPSGKELLAVAVDSGSVLWALPRDRDFHLSPRLAEGSLFLPSSRGFELIDVTSDSPRPLVESSKVGFSNYQSYVVIDHHAYGFSKHFLQCVDIRTGKRRWRKKIGPNGALTESDGMLIILTGNGELVIAEATPERFREVARAGVIEMRSNRGVPQPEQHHCWTRPVFTDGLVLARSNHGDLVCIDLRVA